MQLLKLAVNSIKSSLASASKWRLYRGEAGDSIAFDKVLLIAESETEVAVGAPYLEGKTVSATIAEHGRHKKIKIIKFRRRKHHMKRMGHRQNYTEVVIDAIDGKK